MGDSMGIWLIVKVMPPVQCIRGSPTRNLSRRNPGPHEGTVTPDINLLLYAHDSSSPFHAKAAAWWQSCLSGTESIGLLHVVTFGFVRIGSAARPNGHDTRLAPNGDHVQAVRRQELGTSSQHLLDRQIRAALEFRKAMGSDQQYRPDPIAFHPPPIMHIGN